MSKKILLLTMMSILFIPRVMANEKIEAFVQIKLAAADNKASRDTLQDIYVYIRSSDGPTVAEAYAGNEAVQPISVHANNPHVELFCKHARGTLIERIEEGKLYVLHVVYDATQYIHQRGRPKAGCTFTWAPEDV